MYIYRFYLNIKDNSLVSLVSIISNNYVYVIGNNALIQGNSACLPSFVGSAGLQKGAVIPVQLLATDSVKAETY